MRHLEKSISNVSQEEEQQQQEQQEQQQLLMLALKIDSFELHVIQGRYFPQIYSF